MTSLLLFLPFGLVLVALQTSIVERITLWGGHPDLVLVAMALFTVQAGRQRALFPALLVAPFYDAIAGLPIGASILPLTTVVYLTGMGERTIFGARLGWPLLMAFLATLAAGLIILVELNLLGWGLRWGETILRVTLPSALLNAALILVLYFAFEFLQTLRQSRGRI